MIPKINNICDCCDSDQSILQMFNDQCFKIVDGADANESFCLSDFAFPADGYSCLELNLNILNGETTLFDNKIITLGSSSNNLTQGDLYARGVLLKITYPTNDDNGEEILITDKNVQLWMQDASTLVDRKLPLYNLFTMFTNPKSCDQSQLINKIRIVNQNNYKVKVTGLVIFGEAQCQVVDNNTNLYPNIAPSAQFSKLAIQPNESSNGTIYINNVGDADSSGLIRITIDKPLYGSTSFTLPSGFTLESNNSSQSVITTTNVISPGLSNGAQIPFVYANDGSALNDILLTIKVTAEAGSGGEIESNNNIGQGYLQLDIP